MDTIAQLFWLTINLYHEARGEPFEGMKAVCHVVLNRAERRKIPVKEVILQPWQFSWANREARPGVHDYKAFEKCMKAAYEAVQERLEGKTLAGADHYHTMQVNPAWNRKMPIVAKIGNHIFYNSEA